VLRRIAFVLRAIRFLFAHRIAEHCILAAQQEEQGMVMKTQAFAVLAALMFAATPSVAANKSPGWFLQLQSPSANISEIGGDAGGKLFACREDFFKYCAAPGTVARECFAQNSDKISGRCKDALKPQRPATNAASNGESVPRCSHSPVCASSLGGTKPQLERVEWKQTMGFTFSYLSELPAGGGGVSGVAIDSHDNLWAFQRNPAGQPQLFEFDANHHLIRTVGEDVIGHQEKAHGIAVDAQGNVWICDANGSTVMKLSPQGKLLMTIGEKGHRGDWDEAKSQRLLWQPMDVAFGANGDIFIAEGHADESPNDVDRDDPTNHIGLARVIHLGKDGHFLNQWYGANWGPGKFSMAHGIAVDPKTGDVWIADREQYRLVVYTPGGKFVKTVQMRNLICAAYFDPHGNLWVAAGNDGQLLKIDRDGTVLGAVGNGRGTGPGQFMETNFMGMDTHGNLYSGDTTVGRVTEMVAHGK
jgi:DNA-binding beta-propeller fold protein YncE